MAALVAVVGTGAASVRMACKAAGNTRMHVEEILLEWDCHLLTRTLKSKVSGQHVIHGHV